MYVLYVCSYKQCIIIILIYFTFGTSSRPRVTVTVRCVWAKNNMSIQSGWSPGTAENLQNRHQSFFIILTWESFKRMRSSTAVQSLVVSSVNTWAATLDWLQWIFEFLKSSHHWLTPDQLRTRFSGARSRCLCDVCLALNFNARGRSKSQCAVKLTRSTSGAWGHY